MDDQTPATKGDLITLKDSLMHRMDQRFDRMHEDIDRILNMLVNVKKVTDDHEERLVTVEQTLAA